MIAEQSFDAPDLIRGLSRQRASVRGLASGAGQDFFSPPVDQETPLSGNGLFHLYPRLKIRQSDLHRCHKRPAQTRRATSRWRRVCAYGAVQHPSVGLLRDTQKAGTSLAAGAQVKALETQLEKRFDTKTQSLLGRFDDGGASVTETPHQVRGSLTLGETP